MTRRHSGGSRASPEAVILATLVAVTALLVPPARAAVGVSPTADNTWGTEIAADTGKASRVLTVAVSGGLAYLGGDFAGMSPPGSNDPSAVVRRDHLAAVGNGGTTL